MSEETTSQWICTTLDTDGGERVQGSPTQPVVMGLAAKRSVWKAGTKLKVRFLSGTSRLHERVLAAARSWLDPRVKLSIELATPGETAQIRISFVPDDGSWSNIGTDCLTVHSSQPTMNLGWATLQTPKPEFDSVVIHEWGHALGLLHEHNHPGAQIEWNREAVIGDLSASPNFWDVATIEHNVFARFAASEVITTNFDTESVMIYPIPVAWTTNGKSFTPSPRISDGDRATIVRLYE